MRVERGAVLAAALALVLCGCAAAAQANRHSPGALGNGTFTPSRPAAAQYGPDPSLSCPAGGAFKILADDLAAAAKDSGRPAPQPDGRLCAAADTFLGWSEGEPPPESVSSFVAWHFGVPSATTRVIVVSLQTDDVRVIAEKLLDPVNAFAAGAVAPRFGAATERQRKTAIRTEADSTGGASSRNVTSAMNATKVALVMYDAALELEPLPRKLPAGGKARLAGRLQAGLSNPKVSFADPSGKLTTQPQQGDAVQADLSCGDKPGPLFVEVRADRNGEPASVARFPVLCGVEEPAGAAVAAPDKRPVETGAAERGILAMMNAERKAAGAPELQWDDAVAGVARAASETSREASRPGSTGSGASFDVVARLKQSDVVSALVLVNPAAGLRPEEAQWRLTTTPQHRSNMMNPEATHAGVGVSVLQRPEGPPIYFVTEILVRELPPVDAQALRGKLRDAVSKKRADARAGAVTSDPILEDVAQKYASAMAAGKGEVPKAQGDAIVGPLYKAYRTVNIVAGAKLEPLDLAEEPGAVAPGKGVGVGVAQGMNAVLGKNAVYGVIVIGTRR
jgi:uncharacterized protein YkwD